MQIVLASQSPYRKALLEKTGLDVVTISPFVDEETLKETLESQKLTAVEIARKLAYEKGLSVLNKVAPNSLVISGDQLISFENKILGKPENFENALQQLLSLNGQTHELITSICLFHKKNFTQYDDITKLKMKNLTAEEISSYIKLDQPFDCAGSYKIEKSGIILFESIDCQDFTAIQGIPMIWLSNKLKELSYEFFKN